MSLFGELDIESADTLAGILTAPENAGAPQVLLDLAGVEFIDSTGISALLQARRHALEAGTRFGLSNLPAGVRRLFAVTGITSRFAIS